LTVLCINSYNGEIIDNSRVFGHNPVINYSENPCFLHVQISHFSCIIITDATEASKTSKGNNHMNITDIKIRKLFDEGPMKAIVSVTFDHALAVHDIKVIYARDKFFIVMPSRKNPDGTYRDIVHPINVEFRSKLETAVIEAYHTEREAYDNGTSPLCRRDEEYADADVIL